MRTSTGYTVRCQDAGVVRKLRIEATSGAEAALALRGVTAQCVAGTGSIAFTLSAPASVSVSVVNIAGRLVRTVVQERDLGAGLNTLAFDGRSASGTSLPAGRYLVRISARAEDGQQINGLANLEVTR
jgi:flagellar hook assembly protein FlgD